jgi:GntR family transcriptional regulator
MDSARPRSTFVPLYYQLANLLEQKMDASEYPPGSRLPTETQLATEFDVSIITARSAMKMLLDRGRVERFPGKGTFVLERGPVRATWGLASIADIVMTTANSQMKTLSSDIVVSPDWVWRALGLGASENLHWMRNTRSVKSERFMVSDVYHHPSLTPLVRGAQFGKLVKERKLVVMAVCELAGLTLGEIRQSLSASLASGDLAQALRVDEGSPLLVVDRVFLAGDGSVVQVGKTHYRVDHYRYDLHLKPIEEGRRSERSPRRDLMSPAGGHTRAVKS